MAPDLTQRTTRSPLRRPRRRVAAAALAVVSLLVLTGCTKATTEQFKRIGLPTPASDRTPYILDLWIGSWIAAGIIGVLVWGLIIWVSIRYRRRSNDDVPTQTRYNLPIEVFYTIAPIVVVAVLFYFTVEKQNAVLRDVPNPDHNVFVTAEQWSWTFSYVNEPALGGHTSVYDVGTPAQDPVLYLVKGQSVKFMLHSPDVIHSFWVPSFYFKLDVIPGLDHSFSLTPTRYGTYAGRCAELCGQYHSAMLFTVKVVTRSVFDQHLLALKQRGQIGIPRGGVNSHFVAGLDASAQGGSK